jgi:hypothetical protein
MTTTIDLKDHETRIKALESKITALESRRVPKVIIRKYVLSWEGKGDTDNWFGHSSNDKVQKIMGDSRLGTIIDGYNTGVSTSEYPDAMMSWAWKTRNTDGSVFIDNHNLRMPNIHSVIYKKDGTWRITIDAGGIDDVWDVYAIFLG